MMKVCADCDIEKPDEEYHWANKARTYRRSNCKDCCAIKYKANVAKDPQKAKLNHRYAIVKHRYGLNREQFDALLLAVNYSCPICEAPLDAYSSIDHDHSCCAMSGSCGTCVNGVLCRTCNSALGLFKDDSNLVRRALTYLEGDSN